MRWASPLGLSLAACGFGLAGTVHPYALVWICLLVSGLGVAVFHPPAGRDARREAGHSATAMSYFAAGGSVGFFLGPVLATPALDAWGLDATALFIAPGLLMAWLLYRHLGRVARAPRAHAQHRGRDRPRLFALLIAVEVVRSTVSFGINTFISLYWIRELGASSGLGGTALALELGGGVLGTLAGGRIADRLGLVRTVQLGNALLVPALTALLLAPDRYVALPLAFIAGAVTNIPFAVLVKLGQDYLPSRPGTAAGVTLGLAVSAGGLMMPVLGLIADDHGPAGALAVLAVVPLLALLMSSRLREPDQLTADASRTSVLASS
jgi:FSR family fosmidomycin resistance protein-like MFS transporter